MKAIFLLSGENPKLAVEEIKAITNLRNPRKIGSVLIANCKKTDFSTLAFTHKAYELIFICSEKNLDKQLKKINWQRQYKKDFYVKAVNKKIEINRLADPIWDRIKNPKVNTTNPTTRIEFLFYGGQVICGRLIQTIDGKFEERKAHLRPGFHPTSLHPKLARALVNLSKGKKIVDPFCGTGGILIEAGLIGKKIIGMDIDQKMLERTRTNLEHYKIKKYKLVQGDATLKIPKGDAIVTDPPYGKGSRMSEKKLYENFFEQAYDTLPDKKRIILMLPSSVRVKNKFKKLKTLPFYIHKSLTRNIMILEKV